MQSTALSLLSISDSLRPHQCLQPPIFLVEGLIFPSIAKLQRYHSILYYFLFFPFQCPLFSPVRSLSKCSFKTSRVRASPSLGCYPGLYPAVTFFFFFNTSTLPSQLATFSHLIFFHNFLTNSLPASLLSIISLRLCTPLLASWAEVSGLFVKDVLEERPQRLYSQPLRAATYSTLNFYMQVLTLSTKAELIHNNTWF